MAWDCLPSGRRDCACIHPPFGAPFDAASHLPVSATLGRRIEPLCRASPLFDPPGVTGTGQTGLLLHDRAQEAPPRTDHPLWRRAAEGHAFGTDLQHDEAPANDIQMARMVLRQVDRLP